MIVTIHFIQLSFKCATVLKTFIPYKLKLMRKMISSTIYFAKKIQFCCRKVVRIGNKISDTASRVSFWQY